MILCASKYYIYDIQHLLTYKPTEIHIRKPTGGRELHLISVIKSWVQLEINEYHT